MLIAHGLDNREIADELVLSLATVKSHVNRVFLKLCVRDRAQAVIVAYESGLVRVGERAQAPQAATRASAGAASSSACSARIGADGSAASSASSLRRNAS